MTGHPRVGASGDGSIGFSHDGLAHFLSGEKAQVWARHRDTGASFYLPVGEADAVRDFAKTHLRCPYPGCVAPISTRGGSKRDHFFHPAGAPHDSAPESEFHLASKAMLADWAAQQIPAGATVRQEETVKDAATFLHRIADVMVTGQSGRQVAYEVEYKSFAIEAWRRKQADYDSKRIACLWLIGHTRVRLATRPASLLGLGVNAVVVRQLTGEIVEAGKPVLVINPVTREIGTLTDDPDCTRFYRGYSTQAWLSVDALADCEFNARVGIVTPSMQRIAAAEEAVRLATERLDKEEGAEKDRLAATRRSIDPMQAHDRRNAQQWLASALHATFIERWGRIPDEFEQDTGTRWGVFAALPYWHGVIYEELLAGRAEPFQWPAVFRVLDRYRVRRHSDHETVFRALGTWMRYAEHLGLLTIDRGADEKLLFTPTGQTLDDLWQAAEIRAAAASFGATQREDARRQEARERAAIAEEAARARQAAADERRRTRPVKQPDGTVRWVRK